MRAVNNARENMRFLDRESEDLEMLPQIEVPQENSRYGIENFQK
jgi:hypothetical protein